MITNLSPAYRNVLATKLLIAHSNTPARNIVISNRKPFPAYRNVLAIKLSIAYSNVLACSNVLAAALNYRELQ